MITSAKAIVIARNYVQTNYPDCVEDTPQISRLPGRLRPDEQVDTDAWEICFPWKPVKGLFRSSLGCSLLIDMKTGEILGL